jgi:hypothetical protein
MNLNFKKTYSQQPCFGYVYLLVLILIVILLLALSLRLLKEEFVLVVELRDFGEGGAHLEYF